MLVIANAGLSIEQAVIYKACENVNHSIHLIPQEGSVLDDPIGRINDFTAT